MLRIRCYSIMEVSPRGSEKSCTDGVDRAALMTLFMQGLGFKYELRILPASSRDEYFAMLGWSLQQNGHSTA